MTVKIIAENIIDDSHFIDATEQAGGYVSQPLAATANTGSFRPIATGDIADFNYTGTATADGAAGGTTIIDSALIVYGDDYFIGGTVNVTKFMQDTGDYTESDTAVRIALTTANKVTITNADDDEEFYLAKDFTAAHFNGDFEHHTQINCTANGTDLGKCGVWALTNTLDSLTDIDAASGDFLSLHWHRNADDTQVLILSECNGGTLAIDTSSAISLATEYYLKIKRVETVGTFGTLYCYIYSDSAMSVLVDTLTVTLTEKQDFRYLNWVVAYESGGTGKAWSGTIQNFKLATGESKTITDFAQATGTLTTAAFADGVVNIGSTFTLEVDAATRNFKVELVASGDAGAATFKWSHDGTTYLGRDNPNQATWLGNKVIINNDVVGDTGHSVVLDTLNNNLICIYSKASGPAICYSTFSIDNGITWGNEVQISDSLGNTMNELQSVIILKSGRIILLDYQSDVYISDDYALTWSWYDGPDLNTTSDLCELDNGLIAKAYSDASSVYYKTSSDGGITWSSAITVAADTRTQKAPSLIQANNGGLICAYESDEDSLNDFEIKCKISTNNGATWGTVTPVINFATDIYYPKLLKDINGDIYCFAAESTAGNIVYSRSTDNGLVWGAKTTVFSDGATHTVSKPRPVLINGHQILCCVVDDGEAAITTLRYVRRGIWEAFSANACPVALNGLEQTLINDVGLKWYGGAGILADKWTMTTIGYDYAMQNLIAPSPAKPYRSLTDNAIRTITLDAGANARFNCTGIGLFGCNVRTLSFQMNAADTWGGPPSVNEAIDFLLASGAVDAVSGNYIQDTSLMASYKDHQLSKRGKPERYFLRATSGTESGNTWEILDNVGGYIVLDTTAAHTMGAADTFVIFQSSISKTFTGGIYRFIRISIAAQQTADNYYELGSMVAGIATSLTAGWARGYGFDYVYDIDLMDTVSGGTIPIKGADRKRRFELEWKANETTREEVLAIADYMEGKNICLIPDSATLTACYLVQKDGNVVQNHVSQNKFNFGIRLRENI